MAAEAAAKPRYEPGMDARSTRVARWLEPPMLVASALVIPAVAISESHPGGALETVARALNWVTWLAFLIELVVMLAIVPERRAWLRAHPLDLIVVVLTPPVLPPGLQSLRVLRLLRLLRVLRLAQLTRQLFSLRGLHYAALLAILTAVAGGELFIGFEKQNQHLSIWEGVYWAITSMTTLGSSIYPTTTGGEIVAVVTVLVGISFVALLTGAIAQRFLGPQIVEVEEELESEHLTAEAVALRELHHVREQMQGLEVAVERIAADKRAPS